MREADIFDLSVGEVMARWPATIGVFVERRMHCVGCPIGLFHTVVEAATEHQVPLDALRRDILVAVRRSPA